MHSVKGFRYPNVDNSNISFQKADFSLIHPNPDFFL